jgi:general secretion pathway protein C
MTLPQPLMLRSLTLALVAAGALLAARTVSLVTEHLLTRSPTATFSVEPSRHTSSPRTALDVARLARITGLSASVVTAPEVARDVLPTSTLPVRLLGTLISPSPQWTWASLQDLASQRARDYRVGDKVLGAEVLDIQRSQITVLNRGRREILSSQVAAVLPLAAPSLPSTGGLLPGLRATGENRYEMPRRDLDLVLARLDLVAPEGRIVPAFKDGRMNGFRLLAFRTDSLYARLGLREGDVVRRINGFEIDSPQEGLALYARLKEASQIEIELERRGAPLRIEYRVR